jgi:hypothetical protein
LLTAEQVKTFQGSFTCTNTSWGLKKKPKTIASYDFKLKAQKPWAWDFLKKHTHHVPLPVTFCMHLSDPCCVLGAQVWQCSRAG